MKVQKLYYGFQNTIHINTTSFPKNLYFAQEMATTSLHHCHYNGFN